MIGVQEGYMVFLADGAEGIAAVRKVYDSRIVIYVENSGDFTIPIEAISDIHSQKIILNPQLLDIKLLEAIKLIHKSEDTGLAGCKFHGKP